ncbi:MAG: hypothetical protein ABL921_11815 [Pirellula sp.]
MSSELRFVATASIVLIFLTKSIVADEPVDQETAKLAQRAHEKFANTKIASIKEEIAENPAHPWAGTYFQTQGIGSSTFVVAQKSGVVSRSYRCVGASTSLGKVVADESHLRFVLEPTDGSPIETQTYIPVRWGSIKLLIEPHEILDFLSDYREGQLRSSVLSNGDWKQCAIGPLVIPEKYERYRSLEHIQCQVVDAKIAISTTKKGDDRTETMVTLNVGSDAGLIPGMILTSSKTSNHAIQFHVAQVSATTSIATSYQTDYPNLVGMKLTTDWMGQSRAKTNAPDWIRQLRAGIQAWFN